MNGPLLSDEDILRCVQCVVESRDGMESSPRIVYDIVKSILVGYNYEYKRNFIKAAINQHFIESPAPRQVLWLALILERYPPLVAERYAVNMYWIPISKSLNSVREGLTKGWRYWAKYWYQTKKKEICYIINQRLIALESGSDSIVQLSRQPVSTERMIAVMEMYLRLEPHRVQNHILVDFLNKNRDVADESFVFGKDLNEKWFDIARKLNKFSVGIKRTPHFWARYWAAKKNHLTVVIEKRIKTGQPLPQTLADEGFINILNSLRNERLEKEKRRNERLDRRRKQRDPSPGLSLFLSRNPALGQLSKLVTFLEDNPNIAENIYVLKEDLIQKWGPISDELNAVSGGIQGSPEFWARFWSNKKHELNLILDERILAEELGCHSKDLPPQQTPLMERLITLLRTIRDQQKRKKKIEKLEKLRNLRLERERHEIRFKNDPLPDTNSWTLDEPTTEQLWRLMVLLEMHPDVAEMRSANHREWVAISKELNSVLRGVKGNSQFWRNYWNHKKKYIDRIIDERIRTQKTGSHHRIQLPRHSVMIERMIKFLRRLRGKSDPTAGTSTLPGMRDFSQQTDPIKGSLSDTIARLTERLSGGNRTLVEDEDF